MTSPEEVEEAAQLLPYLRAGMRGLERSHWRPSAYMPVEYLVAPIVLAVLVEVGKRQVTGALDAARGETGG